jgi:hypothetical protein
MRALQMTPPNAQQRRSGPEAATTSATAAPPLPPELQAGVFTLLPFNAQHMTVALLSKTWHDWALQQRDSAPTFSPQRAQPLPAHAVHHAWYAPGLLCDWGGRVEVLVRAAGAGDLELLRWLRYRHCPWDARASWEAAASGRWDVLRWLRSQRKPCPLDDRVWGLLVRRGRLDQLQQLSLEARPPLSWQAEACLQAATAGQLEVLQWLRAQCYPSPTYRWDVDRCAAAAAAAGHLNVLQWLLATVASHHWSREAFSAAAAVNRLDVVQWLRSQRPPCRWNERACTFAAARGHLGVLQWLRSQHPPCPWDAQACAWAARGGHLGVLQWLRSQHPPCPWDEGVVAYARQHRNKQLLQWALAHGAPEQ